MCLAYCISYVHMNIESQQIHKFHLSKTVKTLVCCYLQYMYESLFSTCLR